MKRVILEKVKSNTFFILPAMGLTKTYRYSEDSIFYHLCFAWFKGHLSILLYVKRDDE